jgi:hypothetical protein
VSFSRRSLLGLSVTLPLAACDGDIRDIFSRRSTTVASRSDRMIRWLRNTGRDNMMSPEALNVMGLSRPNGMDIPVKQFAETGPDGRYTISMTGFRNVWEFILHHRAHDSDVLLFHHCNAQFDRQSSVRFPRNGRPLLMTDAAFAEQDFRKQLGFWFNFMPGR